MSSLGFCLVPCTSKLSRSGIMGRPLVNTSPTRPTVPASFSMTATRPDEKSAAEGRFEGEYAPVVANPKRVPHDLEDAFALEDEMATGVIESRCGLTWDAQQVETYDGTLGVTRAFVDEHEAAVGVLRWRPDIQDRYKNPGNVAGVRWCTGTMVSHDIFLSAGHCFDFRPGGFVFPRRDDGSAIPNSELVRELTVEFNHQRDPSGNIRQPVAYPVEALVENVFESGVDFGMVRLGRTNNRLPGEEFGITRVSDVDASIGDMCCIIGHPAGRPKSVEAGTVDRKTPLRLGYGDIDTMGGNSGSGILRSTSGDIVGVHTNGGCTSGGGFNSGMKISAILERSPTLRRIAREMQWGNVMRIPGWYGNHNQGGGITFGSVSSDKATDLIAMHIDNPSGGNSGYYRLGKNVRKLPSGSFRIDEWTDPIKVPGWFGSHNAGGGVAYGNIKSSTSKDLIIFSIDNPRGGNHGYYRIGYGLDSDGKITGGWSDVIQVPGWFGNHNQGGGIDVGHIRSSTSKDLVVMHLDNPSRSNAAYYRVGFDVGPDGEARGGWTDPMKVPGWFGWENQGGGVALFDTNGNGKLDIIIFHIDNPRADNHGYYRVGFDLNIKGEVTGGWSTLKEVPGWFGSENEGGGVAVHHFGPGDPSMAVFNIDNPRRDNHGYVRFGTGSLI